MDIADHFEVPKIQDILYSIVFVKGAFILSRMQISIFKGTPPEHEFGECSVWT